jgi:hypothetical protein
MASAAGQWGQGLTALNPPQSGGSGSYARSSFAATGSTATTGANINDWLVTPALTISNGTTISFYTRTTTGSNFPERLQVRLNPTNTVNVGTTDQDVGDFNVLLGDINPNLLAGNTNYPDTWTQFTYTVSGLSGSTTGHFAFRHYVADGGSNGPNSDQIGIDTLVILAPVPEPTSVLLAASLVTSGVFWYRRRGGPGPSA